MKEQSATTEFASTVCYEAMKTHARACIQRRLQYLPEAVRRPRAAMYAGKRSAL